MAWDCHRLTFDAEEWYSRWHLWTGNLLLPWLHGQALVESGADTEDVDLDVLMECSLIPARSPWRACEVNHFKLSWKFPVIVLIPVIDQSSWKTPKRLKHGGVKVGDCWNWTALDMHFTKGVDFKHCPRLDCGAVCWLELSENAQESPSGSDEIAGPGRWLVIPGGTCGQAERWVVPPWQD